MIFVTSVEDVIRISTGEKGREAITYQGDIATKEKQTNMLNNELGG